MKQSHSENLLGKGAFGSVYSITSSNGEKRAVKYVKKDYGLKEVYYLKLLSQSCHGTTLQYYDDFIINKNGELVLAIVTERLGLSVFDMLQRNNYKGLPIRVVKNISDCLFSALGWVHDQGIIHCDIKPENLLMDLKSEQLYRKDQCATFMFKLIDFGTSCRPNHLMHSYLQSRFYRAPEVMLGARYDQKVDIWSSACLLVECLTGEPLFWVKDIWELLDKMLGLVQNNEKDWEVKDISKVVKKLRWELSVMGGIPDIVQTSNVQEPKENYTNIHTSYETKNLNSSLSKIKRSSVSLGVLAKPNSNKLKFNGLFSDNGSFGKIPKSPVKNEAYTNSTESSPTKSASGRRSNIPRSITMSQIPKGPPCVSSLSNNSINSSVSTLKRFSTLKNLSKFTDNSDEINYKTSKIPLPLDKHSRMELKSHTLKRNSAYFNNRRSCDNVSSILEFDHSKDTINTDAIHDNTTISNISTKLDTLNNDMKARYTIAKPKRLLKSPINTSVILFKAFTSSGFLNRSYLNRKAPNLDFHFDCWTITEVLQKYNVLNCAKSNEKRMLPMVISNASSYRSPVPSASSSGKSLRRPSLGTKVGEIVGRFESRESLNEKNLYSSLNINGATKSTVKSQSSSRNGVYSDWDDYLPDEHEELSGSGEHKDLRDFLQLIQRCLVWDKWARPSAWEALEMDFLKDGQ